MRTFYDHFIRSHVTLYFFNELDANIQEKVILHFMLTDGISREKAFEQINNTGTYEFEEDGTLVTF